MTRKISIYFAALLLSFAIAGCSSSKKDDAAGGEDVAGLEEIDGDGDMAGAGDEIEEFGDGAFLIFTNPAENIAYIIPVTEVVRKMKECGWDREALEVNIDHENSYWRELSWDIGSYYQEFND